MFTSIDSRSSITSGPSTGQDALERCIEGLAHHRAGRRERAEVCYRAALDAEPVFGPIRKRALGCLALLLMDCRRETEAVALWEAIVAADRRDGSARINLASALLACGRVDESLVVCEAAAAGNPASVEVAGMRARALVAAGRIDDAMRLCRETAAAHPTNAAAHASLAMALLHAHDPTGAVLAADEAVRLDPLFVDGWFARGTASAALQSRKIAVDALLHVVELAPNHATAQLNLANVLADLDRPREAEDWLRRALDIDPGLAEAHASLGSLLAGDGRLIEAAHHCEQAIRLRPNFAQAHWNLAFVKFLGGDYEAGWRECEWRKRHPDFARHFQVLPGTEWRGEDLAGKTLFARGEQGIGDTIQFARFLPVLAGRGARVVLACAAPAMGLLAQLCHTVDRDAPPPPYDLWVDMMSVPGLLGAGAHDLPGARGYLRAPPFKRRPRISKPHIGLAWAGNPAHANDRRRSMPASALAPILDLPGFVFTSLQAGPRAADIGPLYDLPDRSGDLTDFTETAKILTGLDLLVCVDTAVAHLAGAMGRPVFLMLPHAPDWRWMTARRDSPWYDSVTIFRQDSPGDWLGVTRLVAAEMTRRFARRA